MKKVLGLDLGKNSIGWALTELDFEKKQGAILGVGSRIIHMSQDILGKFDSGQSHLKRLNEQVIEVLENYFKETYLEENVCIEC